VASLFTTSQEKITGYARVAVERGVDRYPDGLTYSVTEPLADLQPGERVIVPLGRGDTPTASYVIDISDQTELDPEKVKPILQRDRVAAKLPSELMKLAQWISNYYCAPLGMTLATMLPAAVKKNVGSVTRVFIDLGDPMPLDEKLPAKQKAVLRTLADLPAAKRPVEISTLAEMAGLKTKGPINKLLDRGLVEAKRKTSVEAVWMEYAGDAFVPDELTDEQKRVLSALGCRLSVAGASSSAECRVPIAEDSFSVHLLHGVTGSGKTEIYIRLIERVLAAGKSALMLVPEISLTPQTGGRLIGRLVDHRVAILHSGLTAAQRHQQWAMVADGRARVIIGARSAVFSPIPDRALALIIVDEEHDGSYKQDQVPRYHGRDVAIRRAQIANCPIILGSATPSLESWYNATCSPSLEGSGEFAQHKPRYTLHQLTKRVPGTRLPHVQVVDFVEQQRHYKDKRVHLIGPVMLDAIGRTLADEAQALILLNRRGYANYIACPDQHCGWTMQCDDCDVTMVYHKNRALPTGGYVRCHHCLAEQKLPATCPQCGNKISTFGLGTQRVEEELAREFPQLVEDETLKRVDSDTMHGAKDFHDVVGRFGKGEIRVMVGTQMIAKGLDFPGVRLVGVINADTAINLPDFRATERTFQLVSQVAGRTGRGLVPGRVVVQTFNPDSPAIQLAAQHDYESFAKLEMRHRQLAGLPPITRMARIVLRDEDHVKCTAAARQLHAALKPLADESIRLRGPAPCPIARIAGKHRQQIEIIAPTARRLQQLLAAARRAGLIKSDAKMAVDVDPIALL
jgi:primosomal protein N' (replication factor Y) (superfamily II helicase)